MPQADQTASPMRGYRRNPGVVDAVQNLVENRWMIVQVLSDVHGGFLYSTTTNTYTFTQTKDKRLTSEQTLSNYSWLVYDKNSDSCLVYSQHDFAQLFTQLT